MTQINESLLSLVQLSPDSLNQEDSSSVSVHDRNFNNFVSNAFNKVSDTDLQLKSMINALSNSPENTSDPEKLQLLQNYLGDYTNYVSLVSTVARKTVNTIETLEKAQ